MAYSNSIPLLYEERRYADVLNVADWYQSLYPDKFNPENAQNDFFKVADAAHILGDYYRADALYRRLLNAEGCISGFPDQAALARQRIERFEQIRPEAVKVCCDTADSPEALCEIARHMLYVFPRISRPVVIHIADNAADYRDYLIQTGETPERIEHGMPFENFLACGFYHSAPLLRVVFKRKFLEACDRDSLTGTMAHEFAHLEDYCVRTDAGMSPIGTPPFLVQEHRTDLSVVSKGLAYPLYRSRARFSNHWACMSAETLKAYLTDLGDCYTRH